MRVLTFAISLFLSVAVLGKGQYPDNVSRHTFFGKADVGIWSNPKNVYSHKGVSNFTVTANPIYPTLTKNRIRFMGPHGWEDRNFKGKIHITTGNTASSIWVSFISYGKPVVMVGSIQWL